MGMSKAYENVHRKIAIKALRRVIADFSAEEIHDYLLRFSKIELEGWSYERVIALEFFFNDMERSLHSHHRENKK